MHLAKMSSHEMKNNNNVNIGLLSHSINFHGMALLDQIKAKHSLINSQISTLKDIGIDFKEIEKHKGVISQRPEKYQRGLINFLSDKLKSLYNHDDLYLTSTHMKMNCKLYKDRYAHIPPLEYFMSIGAEYRAQKFLNNVKTGNILYVKVTEHNNTDHILDILATGGGLHKYLRYSNINAVLKMENTNPCGDAVDSMGRWALGTMLCVKVLELFQNVILVGTLGQTDKSFVLGNIRESDLPAFVFWDQHISHSECLRLSQCWGYSSYTKQMCDHFRIDLRKPRTLMLKSQMQKETDNSNDKRENVVDIKESKEIKEIIRQHTQRSINYYKIGEVDEAFKCLNIALNYDAENADTLVAIGTLNVNVGNYEKGIGHFEEALKVNPEHQNCRNHLCETLLFLGCKLEKDDLIKAEGLLRRCLQLDPQHMKAQDALRSLYENIEIPLLDKRSPIKSKERSRSRSKDRSRSRNRSRNRSRSKSRSRNISRNRSRSRNKNSSRNRSRSRSRKRSFNSNKSESRNRSESRNKSESRNLNRKKSRSRSPSRSKSRSSNRYGYEGNKHR